MRKNGKKSFFLIHLLTMFVFLIALSDTSYAVTKISSVSPRVIQLRTGSPVTIMLRGTGLNAIRGVALNKDKGGRQRVSGLTGKFSGTAMAGKLTVTFRGRAPSGNYYIHVTNGRSAIAILPITARVVTGTAATRPHLTNNRTSTHGNRTSGATAIARPAVTKYRPKKTDMREGRSLTCDHFSSDIIIPLQDVSVGKHRFKAGEEALLKIKIARRLECDAQRLRISVPSCFTVYNKYNRSISGLDLIWRIGAPLRWNFKLKASPSCRQKANHKQYISVWFEGASRQQKKVDVVWDKPFVAPTTIRRRTAPIMHKLH